MGKPSEHTLTCGYLMDLMDIKVAKQRHLLANLQKHQVEQKKKPHRTTQQKPTNHRLVNLVCDVTSSQCSFFSPWLGNLVFIRRHFLPASSFHRLVRSPYGVVSCFSINRCAGKVVTMSGGLDVLQMKEEDVLKFLAASTHLGGTNLDFQMDQYVYKRKSDGVYIVNLKKTWEKLLLAARAIVAIENPADVCVISSRNTGQRAVLKFASATGATTFHGRFTPGTFTNQIQAAFREPRLLLVTDPRADHQPLTEASYVNIPTIALCNTDSPLRYVDIAIPCNNKGHHSVGLMWWMLSREVLRMRGTISREHPWEVMPDLYFYRDPEEIEKEEQAAAEKAVGKEEFQGEWSAPAAEFTQPEVADWSEGVAVPSVPIQQFPAAAPAVKPEDWSTQPATEDWSTAPTAQATEWGGATADWS
ncbi:hypothetical protein NQZ68_024444 [Dissostichus eleginoides]|nr:hypothetical protein NQZ68_024444 [Dissostichus eleginoides]